MADEIKTTEPEVKATEPEVKQDDKPEIDYKAEYEKLLKDSQKQKDAMDKACSEAASYKKALREKQTEAERAEAERAEKEAATLAELEKYRTESRINSYKTRLMESGYDLDTATTMAAELPEGISDDFFAKQKAFIESQKKTIEAELLNKQPGLSKGAALKQTDIDEAEMQKFRAAFGLK